jgi:DNA gyrase inhibitor GyrI/DNA-binding HxlR family transcriptional regulator
MADGSLFMSDENNVRVHLVQKTLTKSDEDIVLVLASLANKRRLQMLTSLLRGPRTFSELQEVTGLGKTALAHHLGILVRAGVLKHTGKGRYELSADGMKLLNAVGSAYANSRRKRELEVMRRADYIRKAHTKRKEGKMKELEVKIVRLAPMRVASVRAISKTPEHDAWEKMRAWAEPKGLLGDIEKHPVFGFNNPDPSPGQKEYGYEFWIRVEADIEPEGAVEMKEVEGGLYAVTVCKLKEEVESEFFRKEGYLESYKKLADWVKSSKYGFGKRRWLEKAHDPGASEEELVLDIYCPIEE